MAARDRHGTAQHIKRARFADEIGPAIGLVGGESDR
jgi:hypothetical protein